MFKNMLNNSTNSYICKRCEKDIDTKELYAVVFKKEGKEMLHVECFHKEYTPIEEKFYA